RLASAFLRLLAFSVPIVGVVLYYGAGRNWPGGIPAPVSRGESSARAGESTGEPTPAAEQTLPGAASPSAIPAASVLATPAASPLARTDRILVAILAVGPCWVSAIVDGATAIQRQLAAGERVTLEVRRELVLTAGDAAALTLTL